MFEGKAEERSDSWDRGICSGYIHVEGHVTLNKQTEQVDLTVVNCRYKSQKHMFQIWVNHTSVLLTG